MITLTGHRVWLDEKFEVMDCPADERPKAQGRTGTMTYEILKSHNQTENMENLQLKFDALVSPDNNYVSILQTARASGMEKFPVPYVLSNCHHTLCAVGGTVNEDDHVFGLGSAKKYGGIFVPPYRAVLHQYMREMMAGCGRMILGSDSHTRYGALGTMGIGEGGGEVAKQLLGRRYAISYPQVLAVKLTGSPRPGVGPQDVALALIGATFGNQFSKNKVLEFVGPGIHGLSMEYRMGIDVMTTESGALSSIWCTDEKTKEYLKDHGREEEYREMRPKSGACYDGMIEIDLSKAECMIALPFHPSNAVPIREFKERLPEFLREVEKEGQKIKGKNGKPFSVMSHVREGEFYADQALISGCSGGLFENIVAAADILKGFAIPGDGLNLGINPASMPVMADLMAQGVAGELAAAGVPLRPCICGPCFGVTDVPADNQISIRHMTRNYPNREGSKPGQGQMAASCLMDARSIAATVRNGGRLTAATELEDVKYRNLCHHFETEIYEKQVFDGHGKGDLSRKLVMGPNIGDWPKMASLNRHLLLRVTGAYEGSITTDELTPSGEASSFRSNPEKIADYTLISRDSGFVNRAKSVRDLEEERQKKGEPVSDPEASRILHALCDGAGCDTADVRIGGLLAGEQIGDGSSREQAASSQKVLGGFGNLAREYATKRYRSNLINWGILPLRTENPLILKEGDYVWIQDVRKVIEEKRKAVELERFICKEDGTVAHGGTLICTLDSLTDEERQILLDGCLINYYKERRTT